VANKPFGYELLLDLYGADPHTIDDVGIVYNFLEEVVHALGVTAQAPPYVFRSPQMFPDKAGISAWVPLIESGVQVHTLVVKNFVSIDLYSCSTIDRAAKKKLINLAKRFFKPTKVESHLVKRGIKYYED
jgi:S-adenosylmethionine/arginine decarboxylase-like enzyme